MRIAIFLPNWIGDVVMATPAIHALCTRFSDARLIAVGRPYVAGVIDGAPWFDETLSFDRSLSSLLNVSRRLRRLKTDLAVLFPNTLRSGLAAWLSRCRRRIGYARYGRGWLLTDRLDPIVDARGRLVPSPVLDAYNRLATTAGAAPDTHMRLFTTRADEFAAETFWRSSGLTKAKTVVALNPGAAFGSSKYWSVESWATLAWQLSARSYGVLILCGPSEREMARQIVAQAACERVYSLADAPISIGLTKACVRRSDLLITTDSGPRHFAAAFDKPVVTLFGPTHISWTETYHAKAIHLQKEVTCGPCQKRVCPLDHRCMTLLTPEEVFAAGESLLARFRPHPEVRHAG
jgi:lipopolysaccharide heptosyltransferase II